MGCARKGVLGEIGRRWVGLSRYGAWHARGVGLSGHGALAQVAGWACGAGTGEQGSMAGRGARARASRVGMGRARLHGDSGVDVGRALGDSVTNLQRGF